MKLLEVTLTSRIVNVPAAREVPFVTKWPLWAPPPADQSHTTFAWIGLAMPRARHAMAVNRHNVALVMTNAVLCTTSRPGRVDPIELRFTSERAGAREGAAPCSRMVGGGG